MSNIPDLSSDPLPSSRTTATDDAHTIMVNKVSWGAIFAGVVVGLVVQVLLTMLGVGIGIATLDPGTADNPAASTFSIATGIWYVVSGIIAAFAGGYIAARMSGKTVATDRRPARAYDLGVHDPSRPLSCFRPRSASIVGGASAASPVPSAALANRWPSGRTDARGRNPAGCHRERRSGSTGNDPEALNAAAMNAMRALVTGDQAQRRRRARTGRPGARQCPRHPPRPGAAAGRADGRAISPDR